MPGARRIDLDGRCVVPGFADSHVHFPTWSLGLRQARLDGARSLDEALDRVAQARPAVAAGGWLRGLGWRDGDWPDPPTRWALDRVAGDVPVALMAKDYHSLWLNSAALARADLPLERPGGVVERDERGEPTGVLRENSAWAFRDRYVRPTLEEMVEASREGMRIARRLAGSPRFTTRTAGSARSRCISDCSRTRTCWYGCGSRCPGSASTSWRRSVCAPGYRRPAAEARLPEGLHGRHAGVGHRAPARRLRRGDHEQRGPRGRGSPRGGRGLAGGGPRNRRRRQPGGTGCLRAFAGRLAGGGPAAPHRACPAAGAGGVRALRRSRAWPPPSSSATPPPTATSPTACGRATPARTRTARCSTPARCWPTAPTPRWRSSTRWRESPRVSIAPSTSRPPWRPEQALTVERGVARHLRGSGLARGRGAPAWHAVARNAGRSGGARPRPVHLPARRAGRRSVSRRRWSAGASPT